MDYRRLITRRRELSARIEKLESRNRESRKKIEELERQIAVIQKAEDLRNRELAEARHYLKELDAQIADNLKEINQAGIYLKSSDCNIPNLGMHNKKVIFPLGRCLLHECLLELDDITEHRCFSKQCRYYEKLP